jgi:hypothetical protein
MFSQKMAVMVCSRSPDNRLVCSIVDALCSVISRTSYFQKMAKVFRKINFLKCGEMAATAWSQVFQIFEFELRVYELVYGV